MSFNIKANGVCPTSHRRWRLLVAGLTVVLFAGCQPSTRPNKPVARNAAAANINQEPSTREVLVFAAASTQESMQTIAKEFEGQNPGVKVRASFASSSTLAQQINSGASADLFLSASRQWMNFLQEKKRIAEECNLLGNQLVAVVRADAAISIAKPADLLESEVGHIAMAEPDSVPAGIYAKQALRKLGLWEKLQDKVVPGDDVRHALAMVETGAVEVGIVYATDAAVSQKVKLAFPFDADLTDPIVYPLAMLKQGVANSEAREFYHFLQSPSAATVFRQSGFRVLPPAGVQ
jgi:molybdate transport system substrate-binding protein